MNPRIKIRKPEFDLHLQVHDQLQFSQQDLNPMRQIVCEANKTTLEQSIHINPYSYT